MVRLSLPHRAIYSSALDALDGNGRLHATTWLKKPEWQNHKPNRNHDAGGYSNSSSYQQTVAKPERDGEITFASGTLDNSSWMIEHRLICPCDTIQRVSLEVS